MTLSQSNPRGKQRWALLAAMVVALSLIGVATALAIHDHPNRLIQLDRDGHTATNSNLGAEDWQNVCPTGAVPGPGAVSSPIEGGAAGCTGDTTADASTFVTELGNETIFTGGGSKDIYSVSQWKHTDGSVPPKNDMRHGFAARDGDLLYFGGDRFATQGTATFGVWFLQGGVGPIAGGTFSGEHVNGDLHIVADFQASGANSAVIVREWVGDDATGSLQFLAGGEFSVDCVDHPSTGNAGSEFCATANLVDTNSPWAFQSSSGAANVWLPGLFFEGGIDLAALDLEDRCFSDVILQTRSSNQTTAQLKDFVHGQLESCTSGVATTPSVGSDATVIPGTSVHDDATITVGGVSTFGGTMSFYLCGPTPLSDANYTLCTSGGTIVNGSEAGALNAPVTVTGSGGTATPESSAVTINNPGRYCWRGVYSGDAATGVPGSSDSSVAECFKVAKINTTTITTPGTLSGSTFTPATTVVLGATVVDRAVVTGNSAGGDPTGDVNFFVCTIASGTCDGTINVGVAVAGNPKALVSDGDAATFSASAISGGFTPTSVGRYCFRADYVGSSVYNGSSDSAETECFTVTDTTAITSAQKWLPNDSATVASGGGSTAISGTLSFTLHSGLTCTGSVLRTAETFTLTNALTPADRTKATTNGVNNTYEALATQNVSWKVVFTPATGSSLSSSEHCESSQLTVTN